MYKRFYFYFDDTDTTTTQATTTTTTTEAPTTEQNNDKKYTDADLDRIIGEKFAKWQKQQERKISEAKKLAEMTAQERAEHERDALQAELDALKKANSRAEMERTARGILADDGINIPDAVLSNLIGDDAEATNTTVKAFAGAYKKAVQAGITAQLSHKQPSGGSAHKLTRAEIMAEPDMAKRQKLIKQNIKLFR